MTSGLQEAISPREQEVLAALVDHATNAEIAERLFISVRTVESHIASLLRKTGARDRRALAALSLARLTSRPAPAPAPALGAGSSLTSFIGRVAEQSALVRALAEHRLVTAVGPGGVGKTRLALSVAATIAPRFPDGVWVLDLVALTDPDRLAAVVAERLGVQELQGRDTVDALVGWLAPRTVLLVLDNTEHLLAAAGALLDRLLTACPGLSALSTSRARLAVPFEWVFPVPGLSQGPEGDATALFTDRARAAGAPVEEEDLARVARICASLEGVPLAIELAAARCPALGLDGLEAGLGQRLVLLTGGGRADPRHASLRAAIDWSHGLLTPAQRAVLRRASVFATPFTRAAAVEVVAALPGVTPGEVADALAALVDGSLLDAARSVDGTRYRALETVRQYGAEQLEATGEAAPSWSAHLEWCLRSAEALDVEPRGDERWLHEIDVVTGEARAALDRGPIAAHDQGAAHRLADRVARLLFARGVLAESQRRFEQAAALAPNAAACGPALSLAASVAEARQFGTRSVALRRDAADAFRAAGMATAAAIELARAGEAVNRFPGNMAPPMDPAAARPLITEARSLAGDDPAAAGRVGVAHAFAADPTDPGREPEALRVEEVLAGLGDRVGASAALDAVCASRLTNGDLAGAFAVTMQRLDLLAPLGIRPEIGIEVTDALKMATECGIGVGDLDEAYAASRRQLRLPYLARETHLATARAILISCLQGDFGTCRTLEDAFLDGYERAGRPRVNSLGSSAAAAACAAEMRGDLRAALEWRAIVRALTTAEDAEERLEMLGFRVLPLLHRGEAAEALPAGAGLSERAAAWYADGFPGDGSWAASLWRPWYAALQAEAAVLAGEGGAAGVSSARPLVAQNAVAVALLDRAEALLHGHLAALPGIADRLEHLRARYQAARTRVMAGGDLRVLGESEMAACGAVPMVWPVR